MCQQKLTQLPMVVDVPIASKWAVHLLPGSDHLHAFYKKLPNYQSIWASEQSNAMPEVWPTFFFLAFYKLTQLLNPPFFAANEYFQIFNSLFASRSQESPGQFWFGEITQSAPWSRPTVQSTNFIEVLNSESFPMSALVRLQNQNSAKLSSTHIFYWCVILGTQQSTRFRKFMNDTYLIPSSRSLLGRPRGRERVQARILWKTLSLFWKSLTLTFLNLILFLCFCTAVQGGHFICSLTKFWNVWKNILWCVSARVDWWFFEKSHGSTLPKSRQKLWV